MLRHKFVLPLLGGFAALGFTAAAVPAVAQDKVDGPEVSWNWSTWGPARAQTAGIEEMARIVSERTDGKFQIKIHYGEALSPAREALDGIQVGALEGAQVAAGYHPGKNPGMMALELPFLPLGDVDVRQKVHDAFYANEYIRGEMKRWNVLPYATANLPQYEFMGRGDAPTELETWKGKRVRALGGVGEAMRALGATPTTVPAPEVYTGLERGVMDAVSFPFTYAHAAYKIHEIAQWYTLNMAPGTSNVFLAVSLSAYEALPEQYRELLDSTKPAGYEALKKAFAEEDEKNIPMFKERGLTEVVYTDEQRAEMAKAAEPIWNKWIEETSAKKVPARELLDLILAEADKAGG